MNLVNAEVLARERGIEIAESSNPKKGDFAALMHTEVETDAGHARSRPGRCSATSTCGWCSSGRTALEGYLDGMLLVFTHRDVPGLIGFVGTIFGKHGVNIAQMTVGRPARRGRRGDRGAEPGHCPPEEAVMEVRAHPKIRPVRVVQLPPAGQTPPWLG